ncbi:hypothetical protein [Actinoplanes sp. NPDC051411]|uniref:hypothetical protein n=1 Tax=Actinoplanes sp. NPDC051411 TaxID=3155522 RepID=UPI0034488BEA
MAERPAANPDLRELLDLLALLPPTRQEEALEFQDVEGFWLSYADAHPRRFGQWLPDKLRANLAAARRADPSWQTVKDLCGYCLTFFDQLDNYECMKLLDVVGFNAIVPNTEGDIGRRWAQSVCRLAWQLFVTAQATILSAQRRP